MITSFWSWSCVHIYIYVSVSTDIQVLCYVAIRNCGNFHNCIALLISLEATVVTCYFINKFYICFQNMIDWQVMCHTTLSLEPTHTGGQRLVITFTIWYISWQPFSSQCFLTFFRLYFIFSSLQVIFTC